MCGGRGPMHRLTCDSGHSLSEVLVKSQSRDPSAKGGAAHFALPVLGTLLLLGCSPRLFAGVIFLSGDLRTNATVTDCGAGCTLGPSNTDGDYAQWAAVVTPFNVLNNTTMQAITYSYGGGTSLTESGR